MLTGQHVALSVAMCTCDGAAFVREQLASMVAQTRLPDELVVSDDASTDETPDILERFAASAPFTVRVERSERRRGTAGNFEHVLGLTRGSIVALADQDDVWRPDKLERLERELRRRPQASLAFSDADVVDERLRPLGRSLWASVGMDEAHLDDIRRGRALEALFHRTRVTGATTAVTQTVLDAALPFPELAACDVLHDGWLALVAASLGDVLPIPERLIAYRQHDRQQVGAAVEETQQSAAQHWDLSGQARLAAELEKRLAQVAANTTPLTGASRTLVASRRRHLEARMRARRSPRAVRARIVLTEAVRGRYAAHSSGLRSAAKDLLRP